MLPVPSSSSSAGLLLALAALRSVRLFPSSLLYAPDNNTSDDVVVRDLSTLTNFLLSPLFLFVPINMYGHYYLVTHVPPGYPAPKPTERGTDWLVPNSRSWWAPERWGWRQRGAKALTSPETTQRRVRRCRKCDGPKPEVGREFITLRRAKNGGKEILTRVENASLLRVQAVHPPYGSSLSLWVKLCPRLTLLTSIGINACVRPIPAGDRP